MEKNLQKAMEHYISLLDEPCNKSPKNFSHYSCIGCEDAQNQSICGFVSRIADLFDVSITGLIDILPQAETMYTFRKL